MNSFVNAVCCRPDGYSSSGDEVWDKDGNNLSYVGEVVHHELGRKHNHHHRQMWNITSGRIIDSVDQTPNDVWGQSKDPSSGHDTWFPNKMGELISKTESFCDVMSLGPPDHLFLESFQSALRVLYDRSKSTGNEIIVRMMFGNIAGMPVNCGRVIEALTKDLPTDSRLSIWVGAWRRGLSWNHAKLIAVDGCYLHTGGHNLWTKHYLATNPVHDLSFLLQGRVTKDGHRFANQQWSFVEENQSTFSGKIINTLPDNMPLLKRTRVTVSEWPRGKASVFPPSFTRALVMNSPHQELIADKSQDIKLITIGRQGSLVFLSRPADTAILAMMNSSKRVLRLVLQDLGPIKIPGSNKALPGLTWPKEYLAAIGEAIYERGVDVEMVLSNPYSIPGGLKGTEANYGNGWSCSDVAAEIIKAIQKQHKNIDDARLRAMIKDNLKICFVKHNKSHSYKDGMTIGLHSKHFIVDDLACYIGSQNLYVCDLAEWGIIVDNQQATLSIKQDYFDKIWENSYTEIDVNVEEVMDGLGVDRSGEFKLFGGYQSTGNIHGSAVEFYDKEETTDEDTAAVKDTPAIGGSHNDSVEENECTPSPSVPNKTESREDVSGTDKPPQDSTGDVKSGKGSNSNMMTEVKQTESFEAQTNPLALDCCGVADSFKISSE